MFWLPTQPKCHQKKEKTQNNTRKTKVNRAGKRMAQLATNYNDNMLCV